MAWIVSTKVDTCQQQQETVEGGALWVLRGVSRMDAATKPTWTYLRRPRKPTVPRHPSVNPLLPLLWLWLLLRLWPLRVPGAARP